MKDVLTRILQAIGHALATCAAVLRRSFGAMNGHQRLSTICAALVGVSLLLPWYRKISTGTSLRPIEQAKAALFVPSFVEASIVLVVIAVLALLICRGLGLRFDLPARDGRLVAAAGIWVTVLIFYRFVDQPHTQRVEGLIIQYELSWGIFFGLIAALALLGSGLWMLHDERPAAEQRTGDRAGDEVAGRDPEPATRRPSPPPARES